MISVLSDKERLFWDELSDLMIEDDLYPRGRPAAIQGSNGIASRNQVQYFPVELLERIFQEYVFPLVEIRQMHRKFVSLSQVCRDWRMILQSQPTFWSNIKLRRPSSAQVPILKLWLIRSGPMCPLSLELIEYSSGSSLQIMTLLLGEIHRWKDIRFQITGKMPVEVWDLKKGSAKVLESVLFTAPAWPEGARLHAWEVFGSSPLLQQARMAALPSLSVTLLPWHQLTHLQPPANLTCNGLFEVLPLCINLESLSIQHLNGEMLPSSQFVLLPRLKTLSLRIDGGSAKGLSTMKAPILDKLDIWCEARLPPEHLTGLEWFLSDSKCKLRSLNLVHLGPGSDSFLAFFKSPNLVHLHEVHITYADGDTIRWLAVPDLSPTKALWPSLRKLWLFIDAESVGIEDGLIGSMLLTRAMVGGLKEAKIKVDAGRHQFAQDLNTIVTVRELGLNVDFQVLNGLRPFNT